MSPMVFHRKERLVMGKSMLPTCITAVAWSSVSGFGSGWVPEDVHGLCATGGESIEEEENV